MATKEEIREALTKLDPANDDHWTGEGYPAIDAVNKLVPGTVKRAEITEAAPTFTRENPKLDAEPLPKEQPPTEPLAGQDQGEGDDEDDAINTEAQNDAGAEPEPEPEGEDGEDELDELEAAVRAADKEVEKAQAELDERRKVLDAAIRKRDSLIKARESNRPKHANILAIQGYLKRQKQVRGVKADIATQLKEAGVTAQLLQGRAPIDMAMARKTQRGANRPAPLPPRR